MKKRLTKCITTRKRSALAAPISSKSTEGWAGALSLRSPQTWHPHVQGTNNTSCAGEYNGACTVEPTLVVHGISHNQITSRQQNTPNARKHTYHATRMNILATTVYCNRHIPTTRQTHVMPNHCFTHRLCVCTVYVQPVQHL